MKARLVALALVAVTATACGHSHASHALRSQTAAAPVPTPTPATVKTHHYAKQREHLTQPIALPRCDPSFPSPHFDTPDAAMRYLASAWNRNDVKELCTVTNPNARWLLADMHNEAAHLQLNHCERQSNGTYRCVFDHLYPASMHKQGLGHAWLDVAAADRPGWYMSVFEGCG